MKGRLAPAADGLRGDMGEAMTWWPGVLLSILFHAILFSIPVALNVPREIVCEKLALVLEQDGGSGRPPALETPVDSGGMEQRAFSHAVQEPSQELETQPTAGEVQEIETQEPERAEMEIPLQPQVPVPPPAAAKTAKPPTPRLEKKPRKPPATSPAEKAPRHEAAPSTQPVPAQATVSTEPRETVATGDASLSLSTPAGDGSATGHGPVDAPFGSRDGPRFVRKVLPRYPRLARELGKEGTVLLQLSIDERGKLLDVQILKRAGSGFDEEALRAVKDSTFSPARRNGRPVMCRARLPIQFVLRDTGND